jgi:hypothetical protein
MQEEDKEVETTVTTDGEEEERVLQKFEDKVLAAGMLY